jgi:deoxyribodipyrimidine photolyase-related protein
MQANVVGMALYADDGFMATKPYAGGGAYLKRMTGHCRGCRFDPGRRTGDDACPFTTLYWDFVARHETRLRANPRAARAALGWGRFDATEQQAILERAAEVRRAIATGAL